jgi:IS605 OrfB family transposase
MAKARKSSLIYNPTIVHRTIRLLIDTSVNEKDVAIIEEILALANNFYNEHIKHDNLVHLECANGNFSEEKFQTITEFNRKPISEIVKANPQYEKLSSVFRQILTERFIQGCDAAKYKPGNSKIKSCPQAWFFKSWLSHPKDALNQVNSIEFRKINEGCSINNDEVVINAVKKSKRPLLRACLKFVPNDLFKSLDPKDFKKLSIVKENDLYFLHILYEAVNRPVKQTADTLNLRSKTTAERQKNSAVMKQLFLKGFKGTNKTVRDAKLANTNRKAKKNTKAFKDDKATKQRKNNKEPNYKVNLCKAMQYTEYNVSPQQSAQQTASVGMDFGCGVNNTIVLSTGETLSPPKELYVCIAQREKLQYLYDRRTNKNSKRSKKLKEKIDALRAREVNIRYDFTHKVSKYIVNKAQDINVDDFQSGRYAKHNGVKTLNKAVYNASFGKLKIAISYKAKFLGKSVELVNPYFTSQFCSKCCNHTPKKLEDRYHVCDKCKFECDRDLNSSLIVDRIGNGQRQRAAGMTVAQSGATDLAFLEQFESAVKQVRADLITKNHPSS